MWRPTHVQVIVQKARNLISKGKEGTNDAYVTIQLGKEKFQTSVQEKVKNPEWHEECDLTFTEKNSSVHLTVFHRNFLGLDEFLGQVFIPLADYDIREVSQSRWFKLQGKSKKEKYRGELEIQFAFVVHSTTFTGSLMDLSTTKKSKANSLKRMASAVGHKLHHLPSRSLSLKLDHFDPQYQAMRFKEKYLRHLNPYQTKLKPQETKEALTEEWIYSEHPKKQHSTVMQVNESQKIIEEMEIPSAEDKVNLSDQQSELPTISESAFRHTGNKVLPEKFSNSAKDNMEKTEVKKLMQDILPIKRTNSIPNATDIMPLGGLEKHIHPQRQLSLPSHDWIRLCQPKMISVGDNEEQHISHREGQKLPLREKRQKLRIIRNTERRHTFHTSCENKDTFVDIIRPSTTSSENIFAFNDFVDYQDRIGFSSTSSVSDTPKGPKRLLEKYSNLNHQELVELVICQQRTLDLKENKIRDLENYIDNLLLRVMENVPILLQKPYVPVTCTRVFTSHDREPSACM
ncbi:rab11 interacting protein isoform X2 [Tachypleus tridentatus]|uniref:rab11 interacting protein isoform X2 n=1 Tax=Tachypleus tridentatus TaxID=6853 RepID=UPI003FCF239B